MKIGICGDVHWSTYSSIVRKRGNKYSLRLEKLIESINWVEKTTENCDLIVYLGDFFDSSSCTAEEISALQEIQWNIKPKRFLVGNHEMGSADLFFNSANMFNLADFEVIYEPKVETYGKLQLMYLPYVLEENRKPLKEYFPYQVNPDTIIFSHNDIKGIQMGKFISQIGFDIEDIHNNCIKYFNGHLHNGGPVDNVIYNVGNICGQNFSEDAFKYDHSLMIFDTELNRGEIHQNPYALNFYKIDFRDEITLAQLKEINENLYSNSVLSISCFDSDLEKIKTNLNNTCILESRYIISAKQVSNNIEEVEISISQDHLEKFKEYVLSTFTESTILHEELSNVCR